jgi:predicted DNA-binding transcriptional regulator YafY
MRADRLLSILLLLQVHRRMTARELAERLEVSVRTVNRDMEALSAAGVPVYALRGAAGGWELAEGYRTNATGLTQSEVRSLFLGNPSSVLADLGLKPASDQALIKLLASIPQQIRQSAVDIRQRIHIDIAGWRPSAQTAPFLPFLQDALWAERSVRMIYESSGGAVNERVVEPLGLVAKGSTWYLVARSNGELRTYRVSRIREADLLDGTVERPADFDLADYWESSKQKFVAALPAYRTRIRVSPSILPRLRYVGRFARIDAAPEPDPDGWTRVEIRFELEIDARECLFGFGPEVEILDPPHLRDELVDWARRTLAHHERVGALV